MKRTVFFAVLVLALQVSLTRAQINNWSFYRTVGNQSATTSSQILSDSAKEGTKCQSFTVNLPANTSVEWRKPLDKTHVIPFALRFWYKLRNFNAPINQVVRIQFVFQKGDSLRETRTAQISYPTIGKWFEVYSETDTLLNSLSYFDTIILRLYFNPQGGGTGEVVFDNLRMAYGVFGRIDSTVTLDRFGDDTTLDVVERETISPKEFRLSQNYPNPFNPSTAISFAIPHAAPASLKVYNGLGQEVATLVEGTVSAGEHSVRFEAHNLPSGVYFYRLTVGGYSETKRMILLR